VIALKAVTAVNTNTAVRSNLLGNKLRRHHTYDKQPSASYVLAHCTVAEQP